MNPFLERFLMNYKNIIDRFRENQLVFQQLLKSVSIKEHSWKPSPKQWCILEVLCHLRDIEVDDFRLRLQLVLEAPEKDPPSIDPPAWVEQRAYLQQDFEEVLEDFLQERMASADWLESLLTAKPAPAWDNTYQHKEFGPLSAQRYLLNWLAHDYLHIRQITKLRYDYLKHISGETLDYAGNWV